MVPVYSTGRIGRLLHAWKNCFCESGLVGRRITNPGTGIPLFRTERGGIRRDVRTAWLGGDGRPTMSELRAEQTIPRSIAQQMTGIEWTDFTGNQWAGCT